jgi:SNF family Na+-dependent transporter
MTKKSNFNSKKFVVLLISFVFIAGILIYALAKQTFGWPMSAFMSIGMIILGILSIAYVHNQAALDTFVATLKSGVTKTDSEQNNDESME